MKISTLRKALILLALMIAVAIPAAAFAGGSGTSSDPYQVATVADLEAIANHPSAHYKLTKDIILNDPAIFEYTENGAISGVKDGETPYEWVPFDFSGSFVNGSRYYITGLYVTEDYANGGLFSTLTNATVNKLFLDFAFIEADEYAGIVAGKAEGTTTISDCLVSGSVVGCTTKEMNTVGGVVGLLGKGSKITATTGTTTGARGGASYADVFGATSYSANVGGVAGVNNGTIENMVFAGNVYGTATYYDAAIGGIAGYNTGFVTNCRTELGSVGGESTAVVNDLYVGGIVGLNKNTVEYNINGVSVSAKNYSSGDSIVAVGGIVGATVDAEVYESKNTGAVSGEYAYAGGIAGIAISDTGAHYVDYCDNEGAVTSMYGVAGGIVGRAVAAGEGYISIQLYVQDCNNTGAISGNNVSGNNAEVAGEKVALESAKVVVGEEVSNYSGVCNANFATYITAESIQYSDSVSGTAVCPGTSTNTATRTSAQIPGTNRYILRYNGRTTTLPSKPVMVELISVSNPASVQIQNVDIGALTYADGRLTGTIVVSVYRPDNFAGTATVVTGVSVGDKFVAAYFDDVDTDNRIDYVEVAVDCEAEAGAITVNTLVVGSTDKMDPLCENVKRTK